MRTDKTRKVGFENNALCIACGGSCCKLVPGVNFPGDFPEPIEESVLAAVKSGKYVVDYNDDFVDESKSGYYIRPAMKNSVRYIDKFNLGSPCVFLGENGCELIYNERPTGCRMLEPTPDKCVIHGGSREEAVPLWAPYDELFGRIKLL